MKKLKTLFISIFIVFVYLFSFCSSVYCMSLIIKSILKTNDNCISFSFFVCVFILGLFINTLNSQKDNKIN